MWSIQERVQMLQVSFRGQDMVFEEGKFKLLVQDCNGKCIFVEDVLGTDLSRVLQGIFLKMYKRKEGAEDVKTES